MTPSFDPAQPGSGDGGLFRPAEHVLVVPQGSAIAILDLERGITYATTPLGAESWRTMVGGARPRHRTLAEGCSRPGDDEDSQAWARIADYLYDRGIIEPVVP